MTTNDLLVSFIKLDDDAKQRVIEQLKKEGYSKSDIAGLVWLAAMSNSTTKELIFNSLKEQKSMTERTTYHKRSKKHESIRVTQAK